MKKYVVFIVLVMTFCSCSLVRSSSSITLEVETDVVCNMEAELEVFPQKVNGVSYRQRGLKWEN